jgi:hypothetical protein
MLYSARSIQGGLQRLHVLERLVDIEQLLSH